MSIGRRVSADGEHPELRALERSRRASVRLSSISAGREYVADRRSVPDRTRDMRRDEVRRCDYDNVGVRLMGHRSNPSDALLNVVTAVVGDG
jgi:hypothetical protein